MHCIHYLHVCILSYTCYRNDWSYFRVLFVCFYFGKTEQMHIENILRFQRQKYD